MSNKVNGTKFGHSPAGQCWDLVSVKKVCLLSYLTDTTVTSS